MLKLLKVLNFHMILQIASTPDCMLAIYNQNNPLADLKASATLAMRKVVPQYRIHLQPIYTILERAQAAMSMCVQDPNLFPDTHQEAS